MKCWQCFYWYPTVEFSYLDGLNYCEAKKKCGISPQSESCGDFEESAYPRFEYSRAE